MIFRYLLWRTNGHPVLLRPIPNQYFASHSPASVARIKQRHGSVKGAIKYHLRLGRWKIEHWLDKKFNTQDLRIEYHALKNSVIKIERERDVGNS